MKSQKTESDSINQELNARACEHALWIGLLMAQRAGWIDVVTNITLIHATAADRRRTMEALAR